MRHYLPGSLALFVVCASPDFAHAQTTPASQEVSVFKEQGKLLRAPQALGHFGTNLFGDSINYYATQSGGSSPASTTQYIYLRHGLIVEVVQ